MTYKEIFTNAVKDAMAVSLPQFGMVDRQGQADGNAAVLVFRKNEHDCGVFIVSTVRELGLNADRLEWLAKQKVHCVAKLALEDMTLSIQQN